MKQRILNYIKHLYNLRSFKKSNPGASVDDSILLRLPQYISCGSNVRIGANSKLLCWDYYAPTGSKFQPQIVIGDNVHATRNLTIQCAKSIQIESDVLIASDVFIVDYNHGMSPLTPSYLDNPLELSAGVTIQKGAWIGNNVIVLPGVTIGEKSIIGAGAIVTNNIPPYSLAVGIPARVIKQYDFNRNCWVEVK